MAINTIYYMVQDLTSGETGQSTGDIDGSVYTLVKITDGDSTPTGTRVEEVTLTEAKAAIGSIAFGATEPSSEWLACETEFCHMLSDEFRKAQATVTTAEADAMMTELHATSMALSRGLVNVVRARFQLVNTAIIDQPTIDAFTAIIDTYIAKLPRTLA